MKQKSYLFPTILIIAATIVGIALLWNALHEPGPTPSETAAVKPAAPTATPSPPIFPKEESSTPQPVVSTITPVAPPALSPTRETAVSDLSDGLARIKGISLSETQIEGLINAYCRIYEARLDFEVAHAKINSLSPHENIIEIPSYEAEGDQFKNQLEREFQSIVGDEPAARLQSQLTTLLYAKNADWGKYPQAMHVIYDAKTDLYILDYRSNPGSETGPGIHRSAELSRNMLYLYEKFLPLFPKQN